MSLPRKNRLKKQKLFDEIKRNGQVIKTPLFNILFIKKESILEPKIGVIVSKKIDQKAVVRNKIKRRVLSVVRSLINNLDPKLLLLFLLKHPAKNANIDQIKQVLLSQKNLFLNSCGDNSENVRRKN